MDEASPTDSPSKSFLELVDNFKSMLISAAENGYIDQISMLGFLRNLSFIISFKSAAFEDLGTARDYVEQFALTYHQLNHAFDIRQQRYSAQIQTLGTNLGVTLKDGNSRIKDAKVQDFYRCANDILITSWQERMRAIFEQERSSSGRGGRGGGSENK